MHRALKWTLPLSPLFLFVYPLAKEYAQRPLCRLPSTDALDPCGGAPQHHSPLHTYVMDTTLDNSPRCSSHHRRPPHNHPLPPFRRHLSAFIALAIRHCCVPPSQRAGVLRKRGSFRHTRRFPHYGFHSLWGRLHAVFERKVNALRR